MNAMKTQNIISSGKYSRIFLLSFPALLLSVGLQPGCGGSSNDVASASQQTEKICLSDVGVQIDFQELEPEVQGDASGGPAESRVLRQRKVRVDKESMRAAMRLEYGSEIHLNLFDDRKVRVRVRKVQHLGDGNSIAVGAVVGEERSPATIVMKNDVLVANIKMNSFNEHYEIRYAGDDAHTVSSIAPDVMGGCEAIEAARETEGQETDSSVSAQAAVPVVDLLVAYTPAARSESGGTDAMIALIQLGVADANQSYVDSAVGLSARLVGTMEVSSNETADFSADLTSLKGQTDGKWDEVHAERSSLGADQVTLVGAYSGNTSVAGIGYINASASSAFAIVRTSSFSQYTFAHELGHNLGLYHEDGYENTAGGFRTVMAYGSYPRIRRFSNPHMPYEGYATGNSSHDSASILNSNAARMAGLVATVVPPSPTPVGLPNPAPGPTPGSTPAPEPEPETPLCPVTEVLI